MQAGDLQDLPSQIQQKAAMLQNVSGLDEEVSHTLEAQAESHISHLAPTLAWHRSHRSLTLGVSDRLQIRISLHPLH